MLIRRPLLRACAMLGCAFVPVLGMTGCSGLDVTNPSIIETKSLDNLSGANAVWNAARWHFADAVSELAVQGGLLADEMFFDMDPARIDIFETNADRRESQLAEQTAFKVYYSAAQGARRDADIAMPRVRAFGLASARDGQIAELFMIRGFIALQLAEEICPGFPLHRVVNFTPVYGPPMTTDEALTSAIAEFDSALVYVGDSVSLRNFAQMGKARALLGLGRFAEAGTLASAIPAGYVRTVQPVNNRLSDYLRRGFWMVSVANREGSNGLDFVSANDPRVRVTATQKAEFGDTSKMLFAIDKYTNLLSPIVVASAVEARLIEAEVALQASSGTWLSTLNALRTDGTFTTQPNASNPSVTDTVWHAGTGGVAGLAPLAMPSTVSAQVDLLFRERAFWLFATGHRLGDLRRLTKRYGRAVETVFPTGPYRTTGRFGTATSLPFNGALEHSFNSANTGCTER